MYSSLNFRFHNGNLSRAHIRDANTIQFSKDRIRRARWRAPASRKADEHRRCRPRKPGKSVMQESLMTTNGAPCMQVNAQGPTSRRTSVEASSDLSATVIRDSIAETRTWRYDIGKTKNRGYTIRRSTTTNHRHLYDRYRYSNPTKIIGNFEKPALYIACSLNAAIKCLEIDYSWHDNNIIIVIIAQNNWSILESQAYYYWRQYIDVREQLCPSPRTRSIVSRIRSLDFMPRHATINASVLASQCQCPSTVTRCDWTH